MDHRSPIQTESQGAIDEFKQVVDGLSLTTYDGRTVVRTEKLEKWLIADKETIAKLLGSAYHRTKAPNLPINPIEILRDPGAWMVFSILLELDLGEYIHHFCHNDILDNKLPVERKAIKRAFLWGNSLRDSLPNDDLHRVVDGYVQQFHDRQFSYCPAIFKNPHRRFYNNDRILPITEKAIVSDKGATAKIWQISVPEDFVAAELREELLLSRYDREDDNIGPRYHLALKTFAPDKREYFENERDAFNALVENTGMLRCFGYFEQLDKHNRPWYHLLLEFGELDLDEYLCHNPRPVFPDQIAKFWYLICDVVDAIAGIHDFKDPRSDVSQYFCGWHADIKPDNILLVHGKLKLADPGFASFKKASAEDRLSRRDEKIRVRGGTTTFGAPECHMGNISGNGVSRSIDIWSLGCVISLVATWVVLDRSGVVEYEELRMYALRELARSKHSPQMKQEVDVSHGDWFHDGQQVLEAVKQWHAYLRLVSQPYDSVTPEILNLVENHMLCGEQKRIEAKELSKSFRDAIARHEALTARSGLKNSTCIPALVQMFFAQQQQAFSHIGIPSLVNTRQSNVSMLEPQEENPRKSKKSQHYQHSSMLYQTSAVLRTTLHPQMPYHQPPLQHNENPSHKLPDKSEESNSLHELPTTRPILNPLQRYSTSYSGPQRDMMSAAELREKQKRQKRPSRLIKHFGLGKSKQKDIQLAQHFQNRDIHFLVDNGSSMAPVWETTRELLKSLVEFAQGQDPDGPDLTFAGGSESLERCESISRFETAMKKAAPGPEVLYRTDIRRSLGSILETYLRKLPHARKLVIIILTDGLWEGMRDPRDVGQTIVTFYRKMITGMYWKDEKQVGIQFVQMGDDPAVRDRLKYLDNQLWKDEHIADMIDTEPWDGDVYNMLLGSFVEHYDDRDQSQDDFHQGTVSPQDLSPESSQRKTHEMVHITDRPLTVSPTFKFSEPQ